MATAAPSTTASKPCVPLTTGQKAYLGVSAFLALSSVPMCLARPGGTVTHFGGRPSPAEAPTAAFWCRLAAAGDALIGLLCIEAYRANDKAIMQRTLWTNALYSVFHVGAFAAGHFLTDEKHPAGNLVGYAISAAVVPALLWKWGF